MRLKRLELYGYKSFAARTVFEFSSGITAIVGPNGSGKSNIADGVRWVLGEQSYSNLRGRRTEDMIFAGSRRRARLGMAEVALTLDNSDRWLDIDFTEVTIGRRAYRSGENEYLLNGNRVRYREIADLLGAVGLAASNYVVIGQGMVDAALALTPEARRALFEEAAGIAPQLRKRQETLERIQETQRNLERAEDILNELRPRARSLRRQAERAEEYLLLEQDLRELQRIWYGYQWQNAQHKLAQAEAHLSATRTHLEGQRAYARELQGRLEAMRSEIAEQNASQSSLAERLSATQAEVDRLERDQAIANERAHLYEQQVASVSADLEALQSRRLVLQAEVNRAQVELANHETHREQVLSEIQTLRSHLAEADAERARLEHEIEALRRQAADHERLRAQRQAQLEQVVERRAELEAERVGLADRISESASRLAEVQERAVTLQAAERQCEVARVAAERAREQAEADLLALQDELLAHEKAASEARSERDQLQSRLRALQRQREQMGEYHPGVREVLRAGERLRGIRGTVASLMRVPPEFEQAIQSALGSRLEHIVTERWEDAEAAIAMLKERRAGWATFLPLDTLQVRSPLKPRPMAGVIGVASDLVYYDDDLKPVFELLLGHTLVTRDLGTARMLLRERTGATLLVTLDGETVQPSGAVSGGARQAQTQLLALEREWHELPPRLQAAEEKLEEASAAVSAARERLAETQAMLRRHTQEVAQSRREQEATHQAALKQSEELARAANQAAWLHSREEQISVELVKMEQRIKSLEATLTELNTQSDGLAARIAELARLQEPLHSSQDRVRLNTLQTEAEVSARTATSVRSLLESHLRTLQEVDEQLTARERQRDETLRQLEALQAQSSRMQEHLADLHTRLEETRTQQEPVAAQLTALQKEAEAVARQHAQSLERLHEAETDHNQAVLERDRARDQQQSLGTEIEEMLGPIDLPDVLAHQLRLNLDDDVVELPHIQVLPSGLNDEIRQLRARLRRMGSINPEAPKEYERLLERQTFLQGQASDLRGAIASLKEVIEELDQVIVRDFGSTVERVDAGFARYFAQLFGGGTARLVLTDPNDMATTGIDIVAHPPGKHPQRLSLLSGGERALTAVALLFALLAANPVPFCFLDEVDAALDESNVGRFRDMLIAQGTDTQFVVITHNRRTIEAAERIYGISMEDQGVSQSISLAIGGAPSPAAGS